MWPLLEHSFLLDFDDRDARASFRPGHS